MRHRYRLLVTGLGLVALAVALVLLAPWGQDPVAANGTVHYVDADAMGANNGSSWADAFTELQPALDAAASGDQIWVAAGTYTPTWEFSPGDSRSASFQMRNGVAIYGGFDPSVGDVGWEDRDWEANPAILSGDLLGDDGPDFANNDENSYHVFFHPEGTGLDDTAILDGFTVTGGNANGDSPHYDGGGMYNSYASPALTNCAFSNNSAGSNGGGMYNDGSQPMLTNCTFSNNLASVSFSVWGGGGMYNDGSQPTLTNCTFSGNLGEFGGGMVNNWDSAPTLTNCTFSANSANSGLLGGGMLNINDSAPTLTNCILWGDVPTEIFDLSGTPVVTYSNVQGGYEGEGNMDESPLFLAPDNGDFHLHACSPCIDAGDPAGEGLPPYDFEGDDRILDGDGDGTPVVDMGADEVAVIGTCFRVYLPVVLRGY